MLKYMTKHKGKAFLLLLFLILDGILGTLFAFVMSEMVNAAMGTGEELLRTLVYSLVFVLAVTMTGIVCNFLKAAIYASARNNLKNDLFESIYSRNMTEFASQGSAEYINELSNNVGVFEDTYFKNAVMCVTLIISFVSASIVCIIMEPVMLLIMIVLALITLGITKLTTGPLEKSMGVYTQKMSDYTSEIQDAFQSYGVIHLFHTAGQMVKKHRQANFEMEDAKRKADNRNIICIYSGEFIGLFSTVIVLAVAAYFAQRGDISAGMIIAFGHLIGNIVSPITMLPSVIANFHAAKPLKEGFQQILAGKRELDEFVYGIPDDDIIVEHLSFWYGEKCILNDLSYRFEYGKHYALLGESGTGKSTFLKVLSGVYDNYEGAISVGAAKRELFGRSMAIVAVPQNTFLFHDTIRNNITLFDESYSDAEVQLAAEQAGLTKLLDEFTANLDEQTARELEENVLSQKKTIISVTHRQQDEVLGRYDCVLKMQSGRIETC